MEPALAAALLTMVGVLVGGLVGYVVNEWQAKREERRRQARYPWMEPVKHRGAE